MKNLITCLYFLTKDEELVSSGHWSIVDVDSADCQDSILWRKNKQTEENGIMDPLFSICKTISSVESQQGAITIQRCSVENQKGAIATDVVQR